MGEHRLLRSPGRGREARRLVVDRLDARWRFLVGELEVAELGEVGERPALRGAAACGPGEVLAHDVALSRTGLQEREALGRTERRVGTDGDALRGAPAGRAPGRGLGPGRAAHEDTARQSRRSSQDRHSTAP
ncbi:MAG: hypothetical protein AVDCRST_MAG45-2322 [uncultured Solirubrobacterales bacterium]|uniref:Uncharacterized protein n=1 Tax=uncultured Solirubrobacterales bacterium TaxID=768556 RepID=A0A6J4TAV0_9ACTN|nr:MAG: hypothetical protein AVDCRST_MAG45-2322 [uncultured Solirubrobacterales bacterium]